LEKMFSMLIHPSLRRLLQRLEFKYNAKISGRCPKTERDKIFRDLGLPGNSRKRTYLRKGR
jgi:hypothetical protein